MAGRGSSDQGENKVTSSSQEVLPHTFQLATHVTEEKPSVWTYLGWHCHPWLPNPKAPSGAQVGRRYML